MSGSRRRRADLRAAARVGCTRCPATGIPEEWPSPSLWVAARLLTRRYRTRLTRRLAPSRSRRRRSCTGAHGCRGPAGSSAVDRLADETGITAVFRGETCESRFARLCPASDPLGSACVVDALVSAAAAAGRPAMTTGQVAGLRATPSGGWSGRSHGSPVSFTRAPAIRCGLVDRSSAHRPMRRISNVGRS